jgi:hypothetical protein
MCNRVHPGSERGYSAIAANMLLGFFSLLCFLTATSVADGAASPGPVAAGPAATAPYSSPPAPWSARPLPFFYDLYTFRGTGGRTAVVAAFAVPAGRLEVEERARGIRYRFDVTLVLADTALRAVSRTDDSVYVGSPHRLPGEHLLFTHIEVQAPPSRTTLQRVIMTDATKPGIGQLYGSPFPIPDYTGRDLMLSDIALGQPGARAGWERGDVTLALLPTSEFPGSTFDVYYEIYNLPAGHRYVTEIFVEDVDSTRTERAADRTTVRLRFAGEADTRRDGMLQELRRVETSLDRGRYRITVTITDQQTGETASRARFFQVRAPGRGATMVTALPRGRRLGSRNR